MNSRPSWGNIVEIIYIYIFLDPTWQLTTVCNSSSRRSSTRALFWPPGALHAQTYRTPQRSVQNCAQRHRKGEREGRREGGQKRKEGKKEGIRQKGKFLTRKKSGRGRVVPWLVCNRVLHKAAAAVYPCDPSYSGSQSSKATNLKACLGNLVSLCVCVCCYCCSLTSTWQGMHILTHPIH